MKIALVDADIIAFRCAASIEPNKTRLEREPSGLAIARASDMCNRIGDRTQADRYRYFLSGTSNFRKTLYPDYKANRDGKPRPEALGAVRDYLIRKWGGEVCTGYEADDGIGIAAKENFVICTIDKDLKQIAGEHYNFVKDEFEVVSPEAASYQFYSQLLIGDTSDNLPGIAGIGPVKTKSILGDKSPQEMHRIVSDMYRDSGQDFFLACRLFRILRSEEEHADILSEIEGQKSAEESQEPNTEELSGVR